MWNLHTLYGCDLGYVLPNLYWCVLQVAREVYNSCIQGAIQHKTRLLVTNQLQFVSGSDRILYMSEGRIAESGTYEELIKAGQGFSQLMKQAEVTYSS